MLFASSRMSVEKESACPNAFETKGMPVCREVRHAVVSFILTAIRAPAPKRRKKPRRLPHGLSILFLASYRRRFKALPFTDVSPVFVLSTLVYTRPCHVLPAMPRCVSTRVHALHRLPRRSAVRTSVRENSFLRIGSRKRRSRGSFLLFLAR